ncbi:alpha/beta hydrolase [Christiangramia sp. SM2212]|uniref:Alpha/beta hydrolase n=1 Tax=Christiangramia sediminicola TaxID=3073267 RepID=A0ABU1EP18_9FLAO|nr:alpha/beta hydrolase [Christiangramia sp. SM2212]MDR5589898.1 alpha/beta hydrolase [Christiangramia sp. SM2212]
MFKRYILSLFLFFPVLIFSQQKTVINTDSGKIAYQKFGKGYPLLIINGGPGMNSNGFAPLAKMLSEENTTIIYDQRGTGMSEVKGLKASATTIDLMVEDIELLRKELDYDQWIVLGHSFGGMLAYAYAVEHPERVKAMIQSHSGGMSLRNVSRFDLGKRLTEEENDSLAHYSIMSQSSPGNTRLLRKRAEFLAKAYLVGKEHEDAITNRLLQVNREINGDVWRNMRANNFDLVSQMKNFKKPVLIMHGDRDPVPIDIAQFAKRTIPNSELVIMENCGHYGWLDTPEIYLTEVKQFLKDNSTSIN